MSSSMKTVVTAIKFFAIAFGMSIASSCLAHSSLFHSSTPANSSTVSSPPAQIYLGTNLGGINYWSSQLPFLDSFKSSRPWRVQGKQWQGLSLELDQHGWVKRLPTTPAGKPVPVETILHRDTGGYYSGKYAVLYDGEGSLKYRFDAKKDAAASSPGRDVIDVTPSERGIFLTLDATDPHRTGNYLRNIRVVPLGAETRSDYFTLEFLDKVKAFETFRFMDWMETNNSHQKDWNTRPTLESATWSKIGAPVEVMVELANQTNTNPWFTMPHQATDDYVTRFAQYVREHLDSDLKVYVEYSNEVWNSQFQQGRWVAKQGEQAWSKSPESNHTKKIDWYSRRTTEITQIWDEVFGSDKERVIGVMGAQAANLWTGKRALEYAWSPEELSHSDLGIDAIVIAPYFGSYIGYPKHQSQLKQWTKEPDGGLGKLFKEITQGGVLKESPPGGALQQASTWIEKYATLAKQENLELLAYEGGQHLVGVRGVQNQQAVTKLLQRANRDPRMKEVYEDYFQRWYELGGGLFVHFSDIGRSTKWGSWGALEHVLEESSPKYDVLMELLKKSAAAS